MATQGVLSNTGGRTSTACGRFEARLNAEWWLLNASSSNSRAGRVAKYKSLTRWPARKAASAETLAELLSAEY